MSNKTPPVIFIRFLDDEPIIGKMIDTYGDFIHIESPVVFLGDALGEVFTPGNEIQHNLFLNKSSIVSFDIITDEYLLGMYGEILKKISFANLQRTYAFEMSKQDPIDNVININQHLSKKMKKVKI